MKIISKTVLATLLVTSINTQVSAETSFLEKLEQKFEDPQNVGLASGAGVGAVVAGPAGAIVGALFGGLIGTSERNQDTIELLTNNNKYQSNQILSLQLDNKNLSDSLNKQQRQQQIELRQVSQQIDLLEAPFSNGKSLDFQIQFKTGSKDINTEYRQQLVGISRLLHAIPDLKVDLAGYSDQRGGAKYNQQLSHERTLAVGKLLTDLGIAEKRIKIQSYGEMSQVSDDLESNFFQRRVTVSLSKHHQQLVKN
ncbi:sortase-associated OmpA-like protein PdsO [Catenovulum maritimum]|uniref:OmpA-like domain-containing protein n=1 Tax=Catenovulum maritimum TaxID=1513271 RepID=A0A0J8GVV2_9ALTE|nr:sortase-associated OmpA-like protein PdsO [Catenovulum maritimum]KMT66887.1 hypothetical protein XM47_01940 [Catenovulum maritimum]